MLDVSVSMADSDAVATLLVCSSARRDMSAAWLTRG